MLQARERVEQMKDEKKKQIEQKFAQIDEKTEKVRASGWWAARFRGGLHPGGPQAGPTRWLWFLGVPPPSPLPPSPRAVGNRPGSQGQGVQFRAPRCRAE